jgi:clorobiocin/coumermycin A biosynthesis protein CloN7/CouN7
MTTSEVMMMTKSGSTIHTLDVPGARLYYEIRGSGPLLLLLGSPMDSTGFAGMAAELADSYTVVTYDPRGISNSTREDAAQDVTPELQADDVHRLLSALGGESAYVFGSSGGAVVGLALAAAHPTQVRILVAHEPPVIELLPDSLQVRAQINDIYDTYCNEGPEAAMQKFLARTGVGGPSAEGDESLSEPDPEMVARMRSATDYFLAHLLRPTAFYCPEIEALQTGSAQIVVAGGTTSKGQLAYRTAVALAERLGTNVVDFPGSHVGFMEQPSPCARLLRQVLTEM